MTQEELLKQIRTILNDLPFGERGYLYKQTAFDACVKTAEWLQEQMMKDAMECHVDYYDGPNLDFTQKQLDDALEKNGAKVGDKVKVIIVKDND